MHHFQLTPRAERFGLDEFSACGYIPQMLDESSPGDARTQLDLGYAHGGGFRPFKGFSYNPEDHSLTYPGDPALRPLAGTFFHAERVFVYEHAWVCIVQPDGSHVVARMD